MSSIVKKGSQFTPKFKKAAKKKVPSRGLSTPASTQEAAKVSTPLGVVQSTSHNVSGEVPGNFSGDVSQHTLQSQYGQKEGLDTPAATQLQDQNASVSRKDNVDPSLASLRLAIEDDENVGPTDKLNHKLKLPDSAIADSSDEEENNDKLNSGTGTKVSSRRASTTHRRLSGIHHGGYKSRSGSISRNYLDHLHSQLHVHQQSAKIIIPQHKATKRRRSLTRASRRRSLTQAGLPLNVAPALKPSTITPKPVTHSKHASKTSKEQTLAPYPEPVAAAATAATAAAATAASSSSSSSSSSLPLLTLAAKAAAGAAPISKIMNEAEKDTEKNNENFHRSTSPAKEGVSADFVLGLDPVTNKVRKYRRKTAVLRDAANSANEFSRTSDIKLEDIIQVEPDNLVTKISSVNQLPSHIKEEDLSLYNELEFDYEGMTMADLCKPTLKIGEVSSNYNLVQEAERERKRQKLQRRLNREKARNEGISLEQATLMNEGGTEEEIRNAAGNGYGSGNGNGRAVQDVKDDFLKLDADDEPLTSTTLQLTLVDGKIKYSEESAVVVKHRADTSTRTVEQSNPYANPVKSNTYGKQSHTDKWSSMERHEFYKALSMFGTDFSLIAQMFPHRTRKQVKARFALEEKKYPEIVEVALRRKLPVDFDEYCKNIKNGVKTMEQYNEDLRRVRLEHEESMNAIALEREKAFKEDAEASRRREIEIRTGVKPMTRAEKVRELRKNEMVLGSIDDIKRQREEEAEEGAAEV